MRYITIAYFLKVDLFIDSFVIYQSSYLDSIADNRLLTTMNYLTCLNPFLRIFLTNHDFSMRLPQLNQLRIKNVDPSYNFATI